MYYIPYKVDIDPNKTSKVNMEYLICSKLMNLNTWVVLHYIYMYMFFKCFFIWIKKSSFKNNFMVRRTNLECVVVVINDKIFRFYRSCTNWNILIVSKKQPKYIKCHDEFTFKEVNQQSGNYKIVILIIHLNEWRLI